MKLEFAFLAEAATVQDDGTFSVFGGGLVPIKGPSYPAVKHTLVLIGRIMFTATECGKKYTARGAIVDHAGKAVFPELRLTFTPRRHKRDKKRPNWFTVCFNCEGVV